MMKQALYLISLCFLSLNLNAEAVEEMAFATDPWPPYFLEGQSGDINAGIGYQIVSEIFALIPGVNATFPKVPWKRALLEVEQGVKDSIALLLKNDERAKYMRFTHPVMQSPAWMYYNRERFPDGYEWNNVNDFEGLRLGVVRGYVYGEPLDSYIANAKENVFEVTTSKQLFSMLQRQHIDLVPENTSVANDIVKTQDWRQQLGHAAKVVNTDILFIGISKKSKFVSLIPRLNDAIQMMRMSGRIDQITGTSGKSIAPFE